MCASPPHNPHRVGAPSGDGLKRQRRDEFFRGGSQNHIHLCPKLRQHGSQISGFEGRDGTGHAEQDTLSVEHSHALIILLGVVSPQRHKVHGEQ